MSLPPSHPSPKGEGAKSKAFPPWGKRERGLYYKVMVTIKKQGQVVFSFD
jgi:hypothetical protein